MPKPPDQGDKWMKTKYSNHRWRNEQLKKEGRKPRPWTEGQDRNGKGDVRRPPEVDDEIVSLNWDLAFGRIDEAEYERKLKELTDH